MENYFKKIRKDRIEQILDNIDGCILLTIIFTIVFNFIIINFHMFYIQDLNFIFKNFITEEISIFSIDLLCLIFITFSLLFRKKIHFLFDKFYATKKIPRKIKKILKENNINHADIKLNF